MAELYLVRHGQASFGSDDYDRLSPLGVQQSTRLGAYLAAQSLRFDKLVTGSLLRHRQTAQGILSGMREAMTVEEDPDFDEYDFLGLYRAAAAQYPELQAEMQGGARAFYRGLKRVLQLWAKDAIDGALDERWEDFQARVARARRRIQLSGCRRVLVVSSGGVIGATTQQVLDAPARAAIELNLQIYNSSLSRYVFHAEAFSLGTFNATPHLHPAQDAGLLTYG